MKKTRRQISRAIFGDSSQEEEGGEEMEQTDSVQILDAEPLQKVLASNLYDGQCCESGMLIPDPRSEFFHPGSEFFHPGSASKNLSILTQKNGYEAL